MTDRWTLKKFGDCADLIRDTIAPEAAQNVPYIGLEHIIEGGLTLSGYGFSDDVISAKNRFKKGDILFGKLRPYFRKVIIAPFDGVCSTDIWVVRAKPGIEQRFLFYWMASLEFVEEATRASEGTKMPRAKWEFVSRIEKEIPPLSAQRTIAYILGSLDDKIKVNRQMNKTLEVMARAIFQSWFVDFDPVLAKAEGRQPEGIDAETAALFPSELDEVEGREVPKGWRDGRLDELMILQRGFDLPQTQIEEGPYPVVCAGGVIGKHNKFMAKGPGVTTGRSGVIGKVFFIQEDFWPHNTSLWVREFKISKPHHAFFTLQNLDLNIFNAGSAVATLNRNHIHNLPVLLPPENLVDKFEAIVQPLFLSLHNNEQQSNTLTQIRDALMSKLMSGEIPVTDSEGEISA